MAGAISNKLPVQKITAPNVAGWRKYSERPDLILTLIRLMFFTNRAIWCQQSHKSDNHWFKKDFTKFLNIYAYSAVLIKVSN